MSDDAAPAETGGKPAGDGATAPAIAESKPADAGQASASKAQAHGGKTAKEPAGMEEETFFDPNEVPEALKPAYKHMQAAFTKKMQALSNLRQKAEFADKVFADPIGAMQKLAAQFGYSLSRADAAKAAGSNAGQDEIGPDWQPQTWQEVLQKAEERAAAKIIAQLRPMLGEISNIKRANIEKQLAEIDPAWQQYEDAMIENLRRFPQMADDPALLYRVSVPPEVIEARATKKALQKFENKARATVSAVGSTSKITGGQEPDKKFSSVFEAAEWARRKMEEEGFAGPRR